MLDDAEKLRNENAKLREVIATHELCHDSDLNVGKLHFFESCLSCIRQKFGPMTPGETLEAIAVLLRHGAATCSAVRSEGTA